MDLTWIDAVWSVAVGVGLAAAVGLRVFVPMLVLGIAGRAGWLPLGDDFAWLATNTGLVILVVATIVEVGAYSIPTVDNLVDVLAGPVAILAGIVAIAAVTSDLPAPVRWGLAVIAGGGTAGVVQSLTTIGRLKSTGLTGGLANPFFAAFELFGSAVIAVLSVAAPIVAIGTVIVVIWAIRRRVTRHRTPALPL